MRIKNTKIFFAGSCAFVAAAISGCFTISQPEYPQCAFSRAAESAPAIALSGFETTYTSYTPIYGYSTVWSTSPGYYRRGRWHGGWAYPETVSTTTYVPHTDITTAYAEKAQDAFESAGYVISTTNAAYAVDVKFSGPARSDGDRAATFASWLFTVTLTEYYKTAWSARMKITDLSSGRVVFSQNYLQEYDTWVWSPIPVFGAEAADAVDYSYAKNWCLCALVERTVADATAFISQHTGTAAQAR